MHMLIEVNCNFTFRSLFFQCIISYVLIKLKRSKLSLYDVHFLWSVLCVQSIWCQYLHPPSMSLSLSIVYVRWQNPLSVYDAKNLSDILSIVLYVIQCQWLICIHCLYVVVIIYCLDVRWQNPLSMYESNNL